MTPLVRDPARLASSEHDLLVVGGGIYGVALAHEAVGRGARVALLEASDFGCGASWSSLRTIHGGVRHLQRLEIGSLRESVRERRTWLRIAPEIVHPLSFVIPTEGAFSRIALPMGLLAGDLLALDRNRDLSGGQRLQGTRPLGREALQKAFPELPRGRFSGGVSWTDAQLAHPERLILALLRSATESGLQAANYVCATSFLRDGKRVVGVVARDSESKGALEIRARAVVVAAGGGAWELLRSAGIATPRPLLRGVNLVLKRPLVSSRALGLLSSGRYLFLVPLRGRSLLGTGYADPLVAPEVLGRDFLAEAMKAFAFTGLDRGDVDFLQTGLVPARRGNLESRTVVVDHEREDGVAGLVSVLGAKYTTARAAGEAVVDLVAGRLGLLRSRGAPRPLAGARPPEGSLEEQARVAVREEMALHLQDVLLRRVDLGTLRRPTAAEVGRVLEVMQRELAWSVGRAEDERAAFSGAYTMPALE